MLTLITSALSCCLAWLALNDSESSAKLLQSQTIKKKVGRRINFNGNEKRVTVIVKNYEINN